MLRLLLAEAEVRHAREAGSARCEDAPRRRARRAELAVAGALGAAAMLAVGTYAVFALGGRAPRAAALPLGSAVHGTPAGDPGAGVRLDTGDFLTLVSPLRPSGADAPGSASLDGAGRRFVDELMSSFGDGAPPPAGGPATFATPGDPGRPATAF